MKEEVLRAAKQQYIADCAWPLIEKEGIGNIRMDDIARASSYTKKTLYAYFKSKDEIILWVYTDDLRKRWDFQQERLSWKTGGIEKLRTWALSLYEYCQAYPASLRLQNYMDYAFVDLNRVDEKVFLRFEAINNELAGGLRSIFREAGEEGDLSGEVQVDLALSQFLYGFRAILQRAFSGHYTFAPADPKTYVDYFINSFIKSLTS